MDYMLGKLVSKALSGLAGIAVTFIIGFAIKSARSKSASQDAAFEDRTGERELSRDNISALVPTCVQDRCKEYSSDPKRLETYLDNCVEAQLIKRKYIRMIMEEYLSEEEYNVWWKSYRILDIDEIRYEEIRDALPSEVKSYCEKHRDDPDRLASYLGNYAANKIINADYVPAILKEFVPEYVRQQGPALFLKDKVPSEILKHCLSIAHNSVLLETYLMQSVNSDKISNETAELIKKHLIMKSV